MAQPLLYDFGMDPRTQQLGSVTVPKIMEPDPRHVSLADEVSEFMRQAFRLLWVTILPCANQCLAYLSNAKRQEVLCLLALPTPKLLKREFR